MRPEWESSYPQAVEPPPEAAFLWGQGPSDEGAEMSKRCGTYDLTVESAFSKELLSLESLQRAEIIFARILVRSLTGAEQRDQAALAPERAT